TSVQVGGAGQAPDATPEAAATPEATPEPVDLAVGDVAEVADDPQSLPLNLREEASTGSEIIAELEPGTKLEITGELVEVDGYVWYPVDVVDGDGSGFVAAEYLVPADD